MRRQSERWTNASVKVFSGDHDPIEAMISRAREAVLRAIDNGWSGPPFDPIQLAHQMGIGVRPSEEIPEARLIVDSAGQPLIEFNPNRPRGRMRYSIAHEIAHSFFPDYKNEQRNREERDYSTDRWQLEMLCNIGAAELLMPVGSLRELHEMEISIDDLMRLRRTYDVSTEALLLRFIRLTPRSCVLVSASRNSGADGEYRIDYAVSSRSYAENVPVGAAFQQGSVVEECTGIGFTAKGMERLGPAGPVHKIECVGITPFPGQSYPRVLALVSPANEDEPLRRGIKEVQGDALSPRGRGLRILAHVVNDKSASWGGGFARAVAKTFGPAQVDFRKWGKLGHQRLGNVHFYDVDDIEIASLVAQEGFGASDTPRIRYPALTQCLRILAERATQINASVHMPRIGCGKAGGSWEVVSELIEEALTDAGVEVTVYTPPS